MFPLNNKYIWSLIGLLLLITTACAPKRLTPHYETPPPDLKVEDNRLYYKALDAQNRGRLKEAEELWQVFIKRYPQSIHGHNNLGRVYYLEDKLTQATQQFEQGLALEPTDPRLKQNLADALKLQANLLYEDKRFDATIEKLDRLRQIASQEEQQGIQIRIEKVEDKIFEQVRRVDTADSYRDFIQKYPEGINAQRARQRLKELGVGDAQPESSGLSSLIPGFLSNEPETMETAPPVPEAPPKTTVETPLLKDKKKTATMQSPLIDETLDETIVEETEAPKAGLKPSQDPFFNSESFGTAGSKEPVQVKPDATAGAKAGPEDAVTKKKVKPFGSEISDEALDDFLKSLDDQDMQVQPEAPTPPEETAVLPDQTSQHMPTPQNSGTQEVPVTQLTEPVDVPDDLKMIAPFEALAEESASQHSQAKTKKVPVAPTPPSSFPKSKQTASKKKLFSQKQPEAESVAKKLTETKPQSAPERVMVVVKVEPGTYLNVRSEPSVANGKRIGKLKAGDTVPLLKETTLWFQVEFTKGKPGWISRTYASKLPRTSWRIPFDALDDKSIVAS
ncbi:SH3 domain-containing protein [Nitrospina watsonii]|uniref:TPR_REGION domain-containing protein n=1 Tax=Nitrospina watsonii TaxID=1323948 RepID=A0ABM9HH85_9BACT|nr:SH3 domain-containing protein [Nitrospina watsonii]CAI2719619.1 TPR_REGION domain-containing protein [Nitrospina watsonii]